MTEYDYSEEGRRRYIATQNRIANWANNTPSPSQLRSPFAPSSSASSQATARPRQYSSSGTGSRQASMMQFSPGPMTHRTHQTYRQSQAPSRPPPSGGRSQAYPSPSQGSFRSPASTVFPSQSISQAPTQRMWSTASPSTHAPTHRSHRSSSHHSSHHSHHHHRSPTYIISPPPSAGHRTPGVIILPRKGKGPKVVVRVQCFSIVKPS
jgi:hypothetical protein